jgi:hypothetical protein
LHHALRREHLRGDLQRRADVDALEQAASGVEANLGYSVQRVSPKTPVERSPQNPANASWPPTRNTPTSTTEAVCIGVTVAQPRPNSDTMTSQPQPFTGCVL